MTSAGTYQAPHVPVLVSDVVAALQLHGGETVVDGTFGAGGYTRAMLHAGAGRVIGFDRDPDAIEEGGSLVPDPRLTLVNENFSQMDRVLADRGIGQVDAIALDIGVSSMQIDRAERGFSFQGDGPLDMRMSKSGLTAAEFLNSAEEADIARVLYAVQQHRRFLKLDEADQQRMTLPRNDPKHLSVRDARQKLAAKDNEPKPIVLEPMTRLAMVEIIHAVFDAGTHRYAQIPVAPDAYETEELKTLEQHQWVRLEGLRHYGEHTGRCVALVVVVIWLMIWIMSCGSTFET